MTDESSGVGAAVRRFFGYILIGAGALLLATCGLCSAAFAGGGLYQSLKAMDVAGVGPALFCIALGLPGIGLGYLLFRAGRRLASSAKPRPTSRTTPH